MKKGPTLSHPSPPGAPPPPPPPLRRVSIRLLWRGHACLLPGHPAGSEKLPPVGPHLAGSVAGKLDCDQVQGVVPQAEAVGEQQLLVRLVAVVDEYLGARGDRSVADDLRVLRVGLERDLLPRPMVEHVQPRDEAGHLAALWGTRGHPWVEPSR